MRFVFVMPRKKYLSRILMILKNCSTIVGVQNSALRPLINRLQSAKMDGANLQTWAYLNQTYTINVQYLQMFLSVGHAEPWQNYLLVMWLEDFLIFNIKCINSYQNTVTEPKELPWTLFPMILTE